MPQTAKSLSLVLLSALTFAVSFGVAQADSRRPMMQDGGVSQGNQFDPQANSNRPGWRPGYRPGDVRERYICVLDNGGTCQASAGRAGGRCRCNNQTGGGTLRAY